MRDVTVESVLAHAATALLAAGDGPDAGSVEREYELVCADPDAAAELLTVSDGAAGYLEGERALRHGRLDAAVEGFTVAARAGFADAPRRLAAVRRLVAPSSGAPAEEAELIAAAQRGDPRALEALLGRVVPAVARYCRARVGHLPDSARTFDDVVQDVAEAVLAALSRYRAGDVPFVAFVHGIARHKVIDSFRRASRRPADPVDELPNLADPGPNPEALALRGERAVEVARLLDRLPARDREILVMRIVGGLSAEEVGVALGMSPGAVRVAQHRALRALRRLVGDGG